MIKRQNHSIAIELPIELPIDCGVGLLGHIGQCHSALGFAWTAVLLPAVLFRVDQAQCMSWLLSRDSGRTRGLPDC